MSINWDEFQKALAPVKNYEDAHKRLNASFSFSFVRDKYNFKLPELMEYTRRLLGGDSRQRYTDYIAQLTAIMAKLRSVEVKNLLVLKDHISSHEQLEFFTHQSQINALDIARLLKYLIYWVIPNEKYMGGLLRHEVLIRQAIKVLAEVGLRSNLQVLQAGISSKDRHELAGKTGLSLETVTEIVNQADLSRLPWASKATIANINGAGYGSIARLASADPEKLYADFFKYGKSIGKNLKLGNEIENSYRIAKIVPVIVQG